MTDSSANKYHAIPSSEDQTDDHETGFDRNGHLSTTAEWISIEAATKWTYFFLGCAILLPWNALINGTSFFLSRLVDSPFHATFGSYLPSVYTLTNLVCQFYCTFTSKQSSPSRRIFAAVILAILVIASLFISTFIRGSSSTFFLFVMLSGTLSAVSSAYMCTAVYAVASLLGGSFLQTVISGQAAVAVAISAVQVASSIISLWGTSGKPAVAQRMVAKSGDTQAEELSARIFFGISGLFLCLTLLAYTWLTRQPVHKSCTAALEPQRQLGNTDECTGLVADTRRSLPTSGSSRVYYVLERNAIFMFSIACVFAVTLAVYPAITVRVRSVNPGIHPMLFIAFHFLAFNSGDLVGRYICSLPCMVIWSGNKIAAMALSRTLFIPLILSCNIQRPEATPVFFNSDFLYMLILLAMGYTNGYVSTIATLAAASLEHNPRLEGRQEDVDIAATLGGSFIIVGLAVGAISSFGVQTMI